MYFSVLFMYPEEVEAHVSGEGDYVYSGESDAGEVRFSAWFAGGECGGVCVAILPGGVDQEALCGGGFVSAGWGLFGAIDGRGGLGGGWLNGLVRPRWGMQARMR